MKNPAESNPKTADLPSFFDRDGGAESPFEDGPMVTTATDAEMAADAGHETDEAGFAAADDAAAVAESADGEAVRQPHRLVTARRDGQAPTGAGGLGGLLLGCGATSLAVVLATVLEGSNAATALAPFGVTPGTLLVLGGVAFAVGSVRRQMAAMQTRLASRRNDRGDATEAMQESLEFLVAAQHASNERPPAAGEELQHVLMAMQRQDEKINNLTKAIKMYGKPLMEISGQTTELAGAVTQAKAAIETASEAAHQAFVRLEAQLRSNGSDKASDKALAEVLDGVHVIAADVDRLCKNAGNQSLEPLQQKIARVEVAIAAMAQRLENSDVHKSLLRLEDATQKTRDEVHHLRGDGLGKATNHLQDRLDKATQGLADGLQKMRDGNLGGLENGVREIQRELSGVATAVAQIQAVVRSGKVAASAPAPAPAAPAAPATPAAPPAPAAPAASAAPAAKSEDGSGYQTGARSSSGKNVLGAIAKLKQMKN